MKNLLPGTELQSAILDGHGQRRSHERRLHVRMAVAVVPGIFVGIVGARWNQSLEHGRKVLFEPRLELDGADTGRAADVEDVNDPGPNARFANDFLDLLSDVVHVAGLARAEVDFILKDHWASFQNTATD